MRKNIRPPCKDRLYFCPRLETQSRGRVKELVLHQKGFRWTQSTGQLSRLEAFPAWFHVEHDNFFTVYVNNRVELSVVHAFMGVFSRLEDVYLGCTMNRLRNTSTMP